VGKLSEAFYAAGVAEYSKRLRPLCRFECIDMAEEGLDEKNASEVAVKAALAKEGQRILAAAPKGAQIVALCVEGKQFGSEALAKWLADGAVAGQGNVAFVIGSSHGLSEEVKQKAALKLSLSTMTFPHQLARLVLCEQVYRAFMINTGSKYHK
jgi:23S rRNA (pseudouridine1915-N3)-methyltransferase